VYLKALKNQTSEFEELKVPNWITRLNEQSPNLEDESLVEDSFRLFYLFTLVTVNE
jgi:hypothetical protein